MMASLPPPRRWWLLEDAGAAFQHVLIASTFMYDQTEHCPILYASEPRLIARLLGAVLEAAHAYGGKVTA